MLDLIEITNREVLYMIAWAYAFGMLSGVILFYMPVRTKLDTLKRNMDRHDGYLSTLRNRGL